MRVAYILPISWGGIPHYTAELANAVSKLGIEVTVVKPEDSNTRLFSEKVNVIEAFKPITFSKKNVFSAFSISNVKNFISFKNLYILNELKPDIIHIPEVYFHLSLSYYLNKLDVSCPTICTYHNTFSLRQLLFNNVMKSKIYGIIAAINEVSKRLINPDGVIVHTILNKQILIRRGFNEKKIFIIPHGSFSLFKRERDIQEKEGNVVLFFGYLLKNKGVEYLIKAGEIASNQIPNLKIIIAGEGKLPRIRVNNEVFEVHNYYIPNDLVYELFTRAKVVVLPYIFHQGHSGVLNIALAFGRPIIATDVGDLPNLVTNMREGIIVPPKNPEALADAIVELMENCVLRRKMGKNAYIKSLNLSWINIGKKHLEVYKSILGGNS